MSKSIFPLLCFHWSTDPCRVLALTQEGLDTPQYLAFNQFCFVIKNACKLLTVNRNHDEDIPGMVANWFSTESGIFGYIDIEACRSSAQIAAQPILCDIRAGRLSAVSIEANTIASYTNGPVCVVAESLLDGISFVEEPANSQSFLWELGNTYSMEGPARTPEDYVPEHVLNEFNLGFHSVQRQLPKDKRHEFYNPDSPPHAAFRP